MRGRGRGTRCGPARRLVRCLPTSLEKLGQDIRPVSHDAVNPVAKQAAHVGFGVDGPDVDPKPLSVRRPDEPRRHYSQPVVGFGSLQRLVAGPGKSAKAETAKEVEGDQLGARSGRRHPAARDLTKAADDRRTFRNHERAGLGSCLLDNPPDSLLDARPLALYLDV